MSDRPIEAPELSMDDYEPEGLDAWWQERSKPDLQGGTVQNPGELDG